ncbi:MAG: KH domain-containing protein [Nanoarchaeota archaeon]
MDDEKSQSQDMYTHELKIPKERIAVLIGIEGETKRKIEQTASIKLAINSEEGDVVISSEDPVNLFTAQEVVKAIGRGFNPDKALLLLKVDFVLEMISLREISKNKNHLKRIKGRVIGTEGKTRGIIEELTKSNVSVYGKTICIIARSENASIAKRAVEMIIEGRPHSTVYRFLESKRKDMRYSADDGDAEIEDEFKKFI